MSIQKPAYRCLTNPTNFVGTGRFTESKVFKVDCEDCMGSGNEIDWSDENCLPIEGTDCQSCEGKGYYFEFMDGIKR